MKAILEGAMAGSVLGGSLSTLLTGSPAGSVIGILVFVGLSVWYYCLGLHTEGKV